MDASSERAASAAGDAESGSQEAVEENRRPFGRALIEAYYRARQREYSPARVGLSIALGTFVGCLPLYGLHLVLCFGLARAFRLSGPLAYLAAHLNNPWTAAFLLYLELGVGRLLLEREWLSLSPASLQATGGLEIGRDLVLGALTLGAFLALVLGAGAFGIALRIPSGRRLTGLIDGTASRYSSSGLRVWETVRGKLRFDPVYRGILGSVGLREGGRLVDLGCGRGILLAAVRTAQGMRGPGELPEAWPPLPVDLELVGIEVSESAAGEARSALGDEALIESADLVNARIPACDTIVCLDVLHYLSESAQEDLLARSASALGRSGLLLIREVDAGAGGRFWVTRAQERVCSWARGEWRRPFRYRSTREWTVLLESCGFEVSTTPMSSGTPFSNVLFQARPSGA